MRRAAAGDPARAGRPQHRARGGGCGDGGSGRRAEQQGACRSGAADPAGRSRDSRRAQRFRPRSPSAARPPQEGKLVTFGVVPNKPETGYGYIRRAGGARPGVSDRAVRREAGPRHRAAATSSPASTSGTAACSCSAPRRCSMSCARSRRTIYEACAQAFTAAKRDLDFTRLPAKEFGACPQRFVRLRGHGEDPARRRRAARCRLERRRLLVGTARSDCRAMTTATCCIGDVLTEDTQRLLSAVDQPPGRGGRARRITSSSKPRMRCWSRRRTACRT